MYLHVYIFTLAEDDEDAKSKVSSWLDDYADREFYDYAGREEPEKSMLLKEVPASELEDALYETERLLPIIEGDIAQHKASGNRGMEGYSHIRYGHILNQSLCSDMPYFNMENWDWSVPDKVPETAVGSDWYAVKADLHF
jgi:hypothetical protein